jgi:beta-phosphoglucomutase
MIRAILFDFNGVIIDDEGLQLKAYQQVFQPLGVALTDAQYYDCLGMDDRTFARTIFERAGRAPADEELEAVLRRKGELHRELLKGELPLFPGVATFVKACARQWPLAVVSMATRDEIDYALGRAGLADSFAAVVSADDVRACKPDPACYRRGLELLNERRPAGSPALAGADCLVVEDSPPGVESARAAGMRTLGVANTVADAALRAAGAEVVTARLSDWTPDAVYHVFGKR